MSTNTTVAYLAFLGTLSPAQRVALMDVLGSYVENVWTDGEGEAPSEFAFIEALSDSVAGVVTAAAARTSAFERAFRA